MKKFYLITALLLGFAGTAQAISDDGRDFAYSDLEQVRQISLLSRLDGWRRVDDHSIVVWATPFRPYLIELSRNSHGLRFATTIGLTSFAGSVHDRFDSVIVDGLRYPIKAIYKLDRKAARTMKSIA